MTTEQLDTLFNIVMQTDNGCTIIYQHQYEPVGTEGYGSVYPEGMDEPFLLSWGEECDGFVTNCTISLSDFLQEVSDEITNLTKGGV